MGQRTGHARVARRPARASSPARRLACMARALADLPARWPIHPMLGFWGASGSNVPQNVRFPVQDADEPRAKFDAASFILGGEILNRTNRHKIANKQ